MPLLENFTYTLPTYSLYDTEGQMKALHEDGFALIPGVLNAAEIQATRDALDRLVPFGFDHRDKNEHYKCVFKPRKNLV